MPEKVTIPDIPLQITPRQIDVWRDALKVDKSTASAWIGKSPAFWSQFLAGEKDLKLQQLNELLRMFSARAEALRTS
jgi:hypothetical protein